MYYQQGSKVGYWCNYPALVLLLLFCSRVFSHAELQEISPANLEILETSPEEFFARYDEPVSPARIRLLGQNGEEVALEDIRTENNIVRFVPAEPLVDGQYILSVRVISLDAHPIASSIGFSVGNHSPPDPAISEADPLTRIFIRIMQIIHLPIIMLCMGLALYPFFFSTVSSLESNRFSALSTLSLLGLISSLLNLGFWGVLINGGDISTILNVETWYQASATTLGTRTGLIAGGLTGIWLSVLLGQDFPTGRYLGLFGVVLLALSFAASGHAASSMIYIKPVFIIHALVAAVWFASMFILYAMTKSQDPQKLKALLLAFSDRARYLVGVLLVCALILSLYQVNSISALISSEYGLLLLFKLFLVIVVLIIVVMNRWHYTPHLKEGDSIMTTSLRRSIVIESMVLLLIIAVTTVLSSTSPEDQSVEKTSWSVTLTNSSDLAINLSMSPLKTGENYAELEFFMDDGVFEPQEVEVQWSHVEAGIEPATEMASRTETGIYRIENISFLIPGEWTVRINVLVDDFTRERFTTHVEIK